MSLRQPKPENLAKLTPEQREVWDKWEIENEQMDKLIQQALDALAVGDQTTAVSIFNKLDELVPHLCEHGRSIWVSCAACEAIERTLFPDMYDVDGNRLPDQNDEKTQALENLHQSSRSRLDLN